MSSGLNDSLRSVNGGSYVWVEQPDTGGGHVILSVPVQLYLNSGSNSITFGAGQSSESTSVSFLLHLIQHLSSRLRVFADYAADLDRIIVY